MRAVIVTEPGGPEVLAIGQAPTPTPAAGDVLVRVVAAGVNRADLLQRRGHYPPPPGNSPLLGLEVSGHIAAVGAEVTTWSVGDPCVALLAGGGYAEYAAVPAGQVIPPPDGMDLISAAGFMEAAATVVSNLDNVRLAAGESILIHGGAGGIGSFAIQYARQLGCTVIATAGSPAKRQACADLGAEVTLDYHDHWAAQASEATSGRGVDVILDIIGAKYLPDNITGLARGGRLVVIGLQGGVTGELNLNTLLGKNGTITATSLRWRPPAEKAAIVAKLATRVWPLLSSGAIRLAAETRFPLAEAAAAHTLLESGSTLGKILLTLESATASKP
ncbi:MAG: NAD(P)H-quinone oxidoreductase [Propioniciclava sp.]